MHRHSYLCIFLVLILFLVSFAHPLFAQESDLEKATALNQALIKLFDEGRYRDAIPIAEEILAISEKNLGPEHPNVAISLASLGMIYYFLREYTKAEPLYTRALAISENAFGHEHPDVALNLNNLGMLYYSLGDYPKAEPLFKRSLAIREKILGPEHPHVAISLNNLGEFYRSLGDYTKAVPLFKRSLAILEKALGPEHQNVAQSLNNLAELYMDFGNYSSAEPLLKRALEIVGKVLGPEHPVVAQYLNDLAELHRKIGNYAKAEPLYKRSLAILENALGPENPHMATNLNNLGILYRDLGDYLKAELFFRRSLAIRERVFGPEHPDVAQSLNELALFYYSLGDYAKAEPLYKRALTISENAFGPEHPNVAQSLNNLTLLYMDLGDYAKAVPLSNRALAIKEKIFGPEHEDVALSLNNLAVLYYSLGNYSSAELLYKRSLAIRKQVFGPEHHQVAQSLNNLGMLYYSLGDYAKAVPLCNRSLAIRESAFGPEHPDVALNLNNLAMLYHSSGDYAKAEPFYKRSLAIFEKAYSPEHPNVASCLNNLANLYASLGHFQEAHNLFKRTQEIDSKLIDQVIGFTSENQKIKFLYKKEMRLHGFLSLVEQHLAQSPSARKDALNVWLKRKGVILEAQRRFQGTLIYSDDPQAVKTFQELSRVRAQLSKLTFAGPGKHSLGSYRKKMADLDTQKDRLEARLSNLSQAFALKHKIAKADCEKVAGALPGNTVLIEFARVDMFNFKAKGKDKKWFPAHYLAFVLHPGRGDKVGMIDLGDAEEIDKAVARFKKEITNIGDIKGVKATKSSREIYNLVFEPLIKELGDVKEIFISPDGSLNLIPFEVVQGPDDRYLIENHTFNYLAAGRDVFGFGQIQGRGKKALLMGDPDFDMGIEEKSFTLSKLALTKVKQKEIAKRSSGMRSFRFTRIPGTKEEVKAIQALLGEEKAELYTGKEALEEVLRQSGTPSILHLATHGFFLSDLEVGNFGHDAIGRGIQVVMSPKAKLIKGKIENPLLRSGIALAGANNALRSEDAEKSDGIVTAEKIFGLRLRGTDMVVLSACETGLGEVKTGEGVFGLRRAFTQAGTRSLVMSMWAVPDKETKELMVEFYKNILSGKMNRCQALRQAALKEMKIVKERYGHTNPLFWGAFVFMGEP